mmetsp:Transcript_49926/g.79564  ORF Transcript_49926/g.79564 Transcript_49926/m.79564 type:complete len:121 (-) Transcript_49926:160-522(-)|eukprot:CAMPEP_0197053360 /NCGR_PEP_ID=MMETSP1384-20130603/27654_1 /TAXON_ID=29189 /ORGANISM="Ammonia sp." /LENGTH=120 /DNA_ID=CAMNT_0042486245 /DNA_START=88 /DNA_END=450 /DNA_ORIENTATION=-
MIHKGSSHVAERYGQMEDDEVEPFERWQIEHLYVKDLKEMLRKQGFPVSGNKETLIHRLCNPKETIVEMKYSFHRRRPIGVRVPPHTEQQAVDQMLHKAMTFDADNYLFKNGKIKAKPGK